MSFTNPVQGAIRGAGKYYEKASSFMGKNYSNAAESYSSLGDNVKAGIKYGASSLGGAGLGYYASDGGAIGTAAGAGLGAGAAWGAGKYGSTIAKGLKDAKASWNAGRNHNAGNLYEP